jgi:hypothetical protein
MQHTLIPMSVQERHPSFKPTTTGCMDTSPLQKMPLQRRFFEDGLGKTPFLRLCSQSWRREIDE